MTKRKIDAIAFPDLAAQPTNANSLAQISRDKLIVSAVFVDSSWLVVSRYGDPIWIFFGGTTNKKPSSRSFNFDLFPENFRETMKAIAYRYLRRGRNDGKQPALATLRAVFDSALPFFRFLQSVGISTLAAVTPDMCKAYSKAQQAVKSSRGGQPIKNSSREKRLLAVELIYELSQYSGDRMTAHPWEGESAYVLSGMHLERSLRPIDSGKTPLIPDDAFSPLFQAAWNEIQEAPDLLKVRDEISIFSAKRFDLSESGLNYAKNRLLNKRGWLAGLEAFETALRDIRTACYVVVASLSGCRNHELSFIQSNSYYSTKDKDGEEYWWMKSRSTKTGEGATEWMIPPAAVMALKTAEWWARPYQAKILAEIDRRRRANKRDIEIAEAEKHVDAIFLGQTSKKGNEVRTLSLETWNVNINEFALKHSIGWFFGTHQFRRKFANYAARSRFGDLRYLKEHFKHWAMDSTLVYALNEAQELELYAEILAEMDEIKEELVEEWLQPHEPLAGGYGEGIMVWRVGSAIKTFKSHGEMIRIVAQSSPIRSNGHGWCTAEDEACVGNGGLAATRCAAGCSSSVIQPRHAAFYRGLYEHNKDLLKCTDIGPGGLARAKRDVEICARTLQKLGYSEYVVQQ